MIDLTGPAESFWNSPGELEKTGQWPGRKMVRECTLHRQARQFEFAFTLMHKAIVLTLSETGRHAMMPTQGR